MLKWNCRFVGWSRRGPQWHGFVGSCFRQVQEAGLDGPQILRYRGASPALEVDREIPLLVYENYQATISVLEKGFSKAVRHNQRTHRVNFHWISEIIHMTYVHIFYLETLHQIDDIFSSAFLAPVKCGHVCSLISLGPKTPIRNHVGTGMRATVLGIRPSSSMSSWQQAPTGRPQIGGQPSTNYSWGTIGA